jgi:WD40 repeat protein
MAAGINGLAQWDLATTRCQWQPRPIENFWDVEYSIDGRRLALATHDVRVVDGRNGTLVATNFYGGYSGGTGTEITSASLDAPGRRLAFASTGLRFFGVQDLDSGTPLRRLSAEGYAIATRWAPGGGYLAASSSDGMVHLYDANLSEAQVFSLSAMPLALAWSPSGDRLAVGDRLGRVWIWQATGPNGPWLSLGSFQAHNRAIRSLAFSPDGSAIATASSDRLARVWQAADHRLLGTLSGHTATVWSVSWSPNGHCLLTAAADGTLKIWSRPGESVRQDAGPIVTCHQT